MSAADTVAPCRTRPGQVDILFPDPHPWTDSLNVHPLPPAPGMSLRLD